MLSEGAAFRDLTDYPELIAPVPLQAGGTGLHRLSDHGADHDADDGGGIIMMIMGGMVCRWRFFLSVT